MAHCVQADIRTCMPTRTLNVLTIHLIWQFGNTARNRQIKKLPIFHTRVCMYDNTVLNRQI